MATGLPCCTARNALLVAVPILQLAVVAALGGYVEQAKLVGSTGQAALSQGRSTALSADGSYLAVGGSGSGLAQTPTRVAWVFARASNGSWAEQFALDMPIDPTGYNVMVALSNDATTLAVGAYTSDFRDIPILIYTRTGDVWTNTDKFIGRNGTRGFQPTALAISADGNTLAAANYADGAYGSTWIFTRPRGGANWTQADKVSGKVASTSSSQGFSLGVSADGGVIVVGGSSGPTVTPGGVWVFDRVSSNAWVQQAGPLLGSSPPGDLQQGWSLSSSADGTVFAESGIKSDTDLGAAWVFRLINDTWEQQGGPIMASGTGGVGSQGCSVALDGNASKLAVGACTDNDQVGAAYVFLPPSSARGDWTQLGGNLVGSDAIGQAALGTSVSLSADGSTLVVAGTGDNGSVGAVWVYTWCSGSCVYPLPPSVPTSPTSTGTNNVPVILITGLCAGGAALLLVCIAVVILWFRCQRRLPRFQACPPAVQPLRVPSVGAVSNAVHFDTSDSVGGLLSDLTPASVFAPESSLGMSLSTLTQREFGSDKAERKAFLLRQLRHLYRANEPLLQTYKLLGDTLYYQRVGGQGVVQFACYAWDKDRQFALKFFLDGMSFATERAHFMNAALRHVMPPILAIEDNKDGSIAVLGKPVPPFVVTERGESLDEWQCRKNANVDLNFSNALNIVVHLVQRVGELHAAGLAHRDLKPRNVIWLPSRNEWTVIDFGSAATIGSEAPMSISLAYAAPETVLEWAERRATVTVDAAVDVFALGLIAYELLTMTPNYSHGRDMIVQTMRGKLPLPWEADDSDVQMLGFMGEGVLRMLARDPSARPSLHEVLGDWNALLKRGTGNEGARSSSLHASSLSAREGSATQGTTSGELQPV